MNILGSLPKIVVKKKERVGRGYGSGAGAKSGRGTTRHQSAREKIKIYYEGGQNRLTKKFPLLRGKGRNKPIAPKPLALSVDKLAGLPAKSTITIDFLVSAGIIDKKTARRGVKLMAGKKMTTSFIIKLPTSETAKKLIEEAKGIIE